MGKGEDDSDLWHFDNRCLLGCGKALQNRAEASYRWRKKTSWDTYTSCI